MVKFGYACKAIDLDDLGPWILAISVYNAGNIVLWLMADVALNDFGMSLHIWINPDTGERSWTF